MKVKRITGLCLAALLVLSGCGGKTVNGKSVVASTSQGNIFADTLYSNLSSTSTGKSALFSYVLDTLINDKCPVTDDMKENADDMITSIKSSYKSQYSTSTYLSKLKTDLKSAGYTSIANYRKKLIYSLQYAELVKKYVKKNFDTVYNDYYKMATPRMVSIIEVSMSDVSNPTSSEKSKLKEVKALLKEGESFGTVAKKYSDDSNTASAKGSLGVVDTTSSLSDTYGSTVSSKAFSMKEGQVSKAIKGTSGYYFLYCSSTSKSKIKKELKTVDVNSPLLTYDDYIIYLVFNTYKITYHDSKVKSAIQGVVKDALKSRAEERK